MLSFESLPDDVLYVVFSFCDQATLQQLCQVCRKFRLLASRDCFWISKSRKCLATNQVSEGIQNRSCCTMSAKDKCRVTLNWRREKYTEKWLLNHRIKYMPWLQMDSKKLWISVGSDIYVYRHQPSGLISPGPLQVLKGHKDDVCRFVTSNEVVISSGSDGSIFTWSPQTAEPECHVPNAHYSSINGLDLKDKLVLTGSRDKSIKLWTLSDGEFNECKTIYLQDRVWSLSASPTADEFVCGTGGCYEHPLILYSTATGQLISFLGTSYKRGAGVLHCLYENPHSILTCGYDTYIRLWDTRTNIPSAITWENPYDMTVYCLASDQNVTFVSGSGGHGLVWLWDKRSTRPIQMYYVGNSNSPVYSIAFDPCHLYVALDTSLCLLNFT